MHWVRSLYSRARRPRPPRSFFLCDPDTNTMAVSSLAIYIYQAGQGAEKYRFLRLPDQLSPLQSSSRDRYFGLGPSSGLHDQDPNDGRNNDQILFSVETGLGDVQENAAV